MKPSLVYTALVFLLSSCQPFVPNAKISEGHIQQNPQASATKSHIPKPLTIAPSLPKPEPQKKEATHTVIVNEVPVRELLFSLARDAQLNLDVDKDVEGFVTLNAIDQPLAALLERIVETTDLSYEIKNNVLRIRKDRPFLRNYRVDYINMSRNSQSSATVSTQINSTGQGAESSGDSGGGNNSTTEVKNKSENAFWQTLEKNIAAIIYEEKKDTTGSAEGAQETNPNIIMNKESGILGVRASNSQHKEIERFINEILFSTRRQVLIEATIAEVRLSDNYQAGIDWSLLENKIDKATNFAQTLTDIALFDRPSFTAQYVKVDADGDTIQSTLSALETFGDVSIMSSPKVMALNNQTALLKVVDNVVYFTIEVNIETSEDPDDEDGIGFVTYETEVNTVPVGFVMSVTPYISEDDSVTLNVRPTISRVIAQARDPNPALADVGVISEIPVIQVREVESVLKVNNGDIAIMGGLMQDETNKNNRGVPVLSRLPLLGALFRYETDINEKTELVIFIRPIVVKHASLEADLKDYQRYLPNADR